MSLITTIRGHRVATQASSTPSGHAACDRCGLVRAERAKGRSSHNLCRACILQLTPEQLKVWER